MNTITIRIARERDLPILAAIYNQAIQANQTADTQLMTVEDRLPWFNAHQNSKYPLFVAVQDEEIMGYATLSKYRGGRPALRFAVEISYYIHQAHQRKGLGTKLLEHSLEIAKKLGFRHAFAILLDTNVPSVRLLEKFGFEQWGHLPNIAVFNDFVCGQYYYGKSLLKTSN